MKPAGLFGANGLPATKGETAYRALRARIIAGDHEPGEVLNQEALARSLGISTTPLREALRRLAAEGLVAVESHRDARVTSLTAEESRDLVELRLALDPLAVRLAAERRGPTDIQRIKESFALMGESTNLGTLVDPDAHRVFHESLYRASQNQLLIATLDQLWDKAERYRRFAARESIRSKADLQAKRARKAAEHQRLLECVLSGDGAGAASVMRAHISHSLVVSAQQSLDPSGETPLKSSDAV